MTTKGKPDLPMPPAVRRLLPFLLLALAVAFAALHFFAPERKPPSTPQEGQAAAPASGLSPALATGTLQRLVIHQRPRPLPDFTVFDRHGKPHRLAEWKGKVLLVNFWASWCPPCLKEMPEIIALDRAFTGENFGVIAISEDYKGYDWAAQALKMLGGQHLVLLWDKGNEALRRVGERGLPVTLLIDRRGREVARLIGPANWNAPEAHAVVRALLAQE